jgi:hypothetical protein
MILFRDNYATTYKVRNLLRYTNIITVIIILQYPVALCTNLCVPLLATYVHLRLISLTFLSLLNVLAYIGHHQVYRLLR